MNDIILYKADKFDILNESNRLKNIPFNEIIQYCLNKYEQIITNSLDIEYSNDTVTNGVMVIAINKETGIKYIWEYYINWIKIRNKYNNGTRNN